MKKKVVSLTVVLVALIAVFMAYHKSSPDRNNKKPIGVILPLTGSASAVGQQIKQAITLANKQLASPFQFEFLDSENNPAKAVSAYNQLHLSGDVPITICAMSGISKALSPLAKEKKRPLVCISTSIPVSSSPGDFVIRYFIDGASEANQMATLMMSRKFQRIAVIQINDEYGRVMYEAFKNQLGADGPQIVAHEYFDRTSTDFKPAASKILAANLDAAYFIGYAQPLGIAIKHSVETGIICPIFSTFGFEVPGAREVAAGACEGITYTSVRFGEGVQLTEVSKKFIEQFQSEYHIRPSNDAAFAFDLILNLQKMIDEGLANAPERLAGATVISQFGELTFSQNLEAKVPIIFKQLRQGTVFQIEQ